MRPFEPPLWQAALFGVLALGLLIAVVRSRTQYLPGSIAAFSLGGIARIIIVDGLPWVRPRGWYVWCVLLIGVAAFARYLHLRQQPPTAA